MRTKNLAAGIVAAALCLALFAAPAYATISETKKMPNGSPVSVAGTIDRIDSAREFVLRDDTGRVRVSIESDQSAVLKNGMYVTVGGTIDRGIFTTNINATSVTTHKTLTQATKSALTKGTGLDVNGATATTIAKLPQKGLVKLHGVVVKIDNEKEFALQDATGTVNIDVLTNEYTALVPGAQVIVIGYVDGGLLSKDINATKITVVAEPKDGTTDER